VRRWSWLGVALLMLLAAACGGSANEEKPTEIQADSGEEDAYQTAVYAQQKTEWQAEALAGDVLAQRQLGIMFYLGQGMEPDYAKAAEWLGRAAEQGDDVAQMTFGVMHVEGQGVPENFVEAHKWFSLSAQQENKGAITRLGDLAAEMSPEQIAEAEQVAQDWIAGK
jgi:TPR repeat protein